VVAGEFSEVGNPGTLGMTREGVDAKGEGVVRPQQLPSRFVNHVPLFTEIGGSGLSVLKYLLYAAIQSEAISR
jgi:hypothetical protein